MSLLEKLQRMQAHAERVDKRLDAAIAKNKAKLEAPPTQSQEAVNKMGRGVLWVALPPLGLWRSVRHSQRKRDERLAEMIKR